MVKVLDNTGQVWSVMIDGGAPQPFPTAGHVRGLDRIAKAGVPRARSEEQEEAESASSLDDRVEDVVRGRHPALDGNLSVEAVESPSGVESLRPPATTGDGTFFDPLQMQVAVGEAGAEVVSAHEIMENPLKWHELVANEPNDTIRQAFVVEYLGPMGNSGRDEERLDHLRMADFITMALTQIQLFKSLVVYPQIWTQSKPLVYRVVMHLAKHMEMLLRKRTKRDDARKALIFAQSYPNLYRGVTRDVARAAAQATHQQARENFVDLGPTPRHRRQPERQKGAPRDRSRVFRKQQFGPKPP